MRAERGRQGAWRYEEDLLNRRRLAVIGGGHCAAAFAEVTARRGCRVRQFDSRTEVVPTDREAAFGAVSHVADYAAAGPRIAYPELTAVVVMTATTAPNAGGARHRRRDAGGDRRQRRRAAPARTEPPVAPSPADLLTC